MQKYHHLFFDLDHTLWDYEANTREALREVFYKMGVDRMFDSFHQFHTLFSSENQTLWQLFRTRKINKTTFQTDRFYQTFYKAGIDDSKLSACFCEEFNLALLRQTQLTEHAIEILQWLAQRYRLYVISNGNYKDQLQKMNNGHLLPFFTKLFISETIGAQKPQRAFFEYAIKSANARKKESLVIGDNYESDIVGAMNFGLDYVYFNPLKNKHNLSLQHEIYSLNDLKLLL